MASRAVGVGFLGLVIAIAYLATAKVGFQFAVVAEQITMVWAPTGIGIAALLIFGLRMWPAVWLGAFAANAGADAPLWTAAVVAGGNSLEAVLAAWALQRMPQFDRALVHVRSTIAYIALGAFASTTVSATVGVMALCAAGVQPWPRFAALWQDWWLGDAVGALIVGPVILTAAMPQGWRQRDWLEAGALVGGAALTTHLVFGQQFGPLGTHPLEYVIFPFVIAAAMRRGPHVSTLVVLAASVVSIAHTARRIGPFASADIHESLILLQAFMGVLASTGLVMAAVSAEQKRGEQHLARARIQAEAANRAKDEFLATLSHELRTPLNAIVGWTRILLDGRVDAAATRRALEVIDRNAQQQAKLISDILDVSRIITGRVHLESRAVDLTTVITAAIDAVRLSAQARNIEIRPHLTMTSPIVQGDPHRLQQVVWNLLTNAVKFTDGGGVIDVGLSDAGTGRIRLQVRDTGHGIDPAFLPHVFERFSQADPSPSRQHGGLGVGLAIVRHLVELHGGAVRAKSDGVGLGATFIVDLPRTDASAQAGEASVAKPSASHAEQAAPLKGVHVLVIDDHDDTRDLLSSILVSAGAETRVASSVGEALRSLDARRPDAVLADIAMPGATGFDLIREIRRRDESAGGHLPAAAVTAYASDEDRDRTLAAGFDGYMPKPFTPPAVVDTVLAICRRSGNRNVI